jgi:hypothetical protein
MAQRSLHAVTKVYYRSMSCFATVSRQTVPACSAKVSHTKCPLLHHVVQSSSQSRSQRLIRKYGVIPTQPIVFLIIKQFVPYRTRGGTCCSGVSTPKIRSLAYSCMTSSRPRVTTPSAGLVFHLAQPLFQPKPQVAGQGCSTPCGTSCSMEGIFIDPNKVQDVLSCKAPMSVSNIQNFLGSARYY